ncbi:MAG TPA: molybdenum cofactor guanylyltransferase [Pyrinomonadaceae bacterium]|jgi:molybdopterin-guanine dinucleotide biosynthesis protein A|nr:molybdenum cofactor guanylyltransferase [Pyrinomonadaceae bacterium]
MKARANFRARVRNISEFDGFILAGGASSRMGFDKSRLRIGGRTFVERIAEALYSVAARVSVVSSRDDAASHGLRVVRDVHAGRGALGGIHAALASGRAPRAFVVSCDLPFVTPELFARLAEFTGQSSDAVAPVQEDGRQQPLCAIYSREACLPVAAELIREGDLRPRSLLQRVRTRFVAFDELSDLESSELFFANVNTPEDYEKAKLKMPAAKESRQ